MTLWARFRWSLVVVDRWSLFRGCFSTKIARAGFRVVVVDRSSLFGGGRNTGLTVHSFLIGLVFIWFGLKIFYMVYEIDYKSLN